MPVAELSPSLLPPIHIHPKLPSLEGLLKQMQVGGSAASPTHNQSPVQRSPGGPMPSLRAVISPLSRSPVMPRATPLIPLAYPSFQSQSHQELAFQQMQSTRKRSWAEASSPERVYSPMTRHIGSPASSTTSSIATSTTTTTHHHHHQPHRSRASKYCKVEGCERVSQRNNLCHSHGGKRLCKEDGCSSKDRGNGYCIKHGGGKICSMAGCEKKARRKGLCTQHFRVAEEGVAGPFRAVYGSM